MPFFRPLLGPLNASLHPGGRPPVPLDVPLRLAIHLPKCLGQIRVIHLDHIDYGILHAKAGDVENGWPIAPNPSGIRDAGIGSRRPGW